MDQRSRTSSAPTTRPRRLRIAAACSSLFVTLVAVLGATGVLPVDGTSEPAFAGASTPQAGSLAQTGAVATLSGSVSSSLPLYPEIVRDEQQPTPATLPRSSGTGKRVVFDMSDQRVWLVAPGRKVRRTYLVSGSLTDNLGPGTYEVYSKSRHAVGIDDSGTMEYMVRFTQGEYAAIGFHDIPVNDGTLVQTRSQLGSPQSHGCIRQFHRDAKALWKFAPVGTSVVVLD